MKLDRDGRRPEPGGIGLCTLGNRLVATRRDGVRFWRHYAECECPDYSPWADMTITERTQSVLALGRVRFVDLAKADEFRTAALELLTGFSGTASDRLERVRADAEARADKAIAEAEMKVEGRITAGVQEALTGVRAQAKLEAERSVAQAKLAAGRAGERALSLVKAEKAAAQAMVVDARRRAAVEVRAEMKDEIRLAQNKAHADVEAIWNEAEEARQTAAGYYTKWVTNYGDRVEKAKAYLSRCDARHQEDRQVQLVLATRQEDLVTLRKEYGFAADFTEWAKATIELRKELATLRKERGLAEDFAHWADATAETKRELVEARKAIRTIEEVNA